jgi:L-cysteine desulfidase
MNTQKITRLLKKEMIVAMGCTEPAAAALAGAKAVELLGVFPETAVVYASRDMIKNAMGVGIPNCGLCGIQAAVALGICGGKADNGLSILSVVTSEQQKQADTFASMVSLKMVEGVPPVYIKVALKGHGHTASCEISREHDCFTSMVRDGNELCIERTTQGDKEDAEYLSDGEVASLTIPAILAYADSVPVSDIRFVIDGAFTNMKVARHAIEKSYGLSVGKIALEGTHNKPTSLPEAISIGASLAAAASDARMAGCPLPVVINSGSGNQGITCTIPILIMAEYLGSEESRLAQALCISQLVALSLTARKDRLSALCGAFTAAIGTSCGMVFLLGGGGEQMDMAVKTMVANLTGIICDGAKMTCALKIYSCIEAAGLSCRLACKGLSPGTESGIIGEDSLQTIDYLSRISHEGMIETDRTILDIMLEKQRRDE